MTNHYQVAAILLFSTIFAACMCCISSMLIGWFSGWNELQQHYSDDGNEETLLKLRWVSASMGSWAIYLKHCLFLGATSSGLSISMFRLFAPFQRPLLIPWNDVHVEQASTLGQAKVRLVFGNPALSQLRLNQFTWARLVDVLPSSVDTERLKAPGQSTVDDGLVAANLFLQWVLMTAGVTVLFYLKAQATGHAQLPLTLVLGIAAIACAIGQVARYVRLT